MLNKHASYDDQRTMEEVLTELICISMQVPDHLVSSFIALAEMIANELPPDAIDRSHDYASLRHTQKDSATYDDGRYDERYQ